MLGQTLAKKVRLKPSDIILIQGVLSDRCLELQVKGIYRSNSAMDDEALAPIYVGQWLRGADYDHVTLVRVKIDKTVTGLKEILEELAKASEPGSSEQDEQGPPEQSVIPEVKAYFRIEDLGVEDAQKFMKGYLDRYGITREALLIISMMVFLLSSASIAMASKTLVNQHREEIGILRSIGASKTTVKKDILAKLLLWSLVASAIGILLGAAVLHFVEMEGYWQILSHTVTLQLDPIIIIADFILVSLLVALSILGLDLEWKASLSPS
jgi:putative ABC transport system permease protein